MAYDGITVAAVTDELNKKLSGGRVYRIAQPESDAIVLTDCCFLPMRHFRWFILRMRTGKIP